MEIWRRYGVSDPLHCGTNVSKNISFYSDHNKFFSYFNVEVRGQQPTIETRKFQQIRLHQCTRDGTRLNHGWKKSSQGTNRTLMNYTVSTAIRPKGAQPMKIWIKFLAFSKIFTNFKRISWKMQKLKNLQFFEISEISINICIIFLK